MEPLGSKLRSLRKEKRMSLQALAKRARCSQSYLSMVENGKVDPSVSRLKRIAEGLGVTIVALFQEEPTHTVVTHRSERAKGTHIASKTDVELLVPNIPDRQIDARLATMHPGASSYGSYEHSGEEMGLVLKGAFQLSVNGLTYDLVEGDSFYFKSSLEHSYRNHSDEDAIVIWVNHPPSY